MVIPADQGRYYFSWHGTMGLGPVKNEVRRIKAHLGMA
jgi:hypothetical protein